jgi:THAP4-like, heme-binding beta-barrel domain
MSEGIPGRPAFLDAGPVPEYPFEATHDLRTGPPLHPALNNLVPFVGVWRGRGQGDYPTIEAFDYAQEVRFSHDGRPFLHYRSRAWIVDADGNALRPAAQEVGFWRAVQADGKATGEIEVLLSHASGFLELYLGRVDGVRIEMATDAVMRTATAKDVRAGHRLYGIVEGALLYAYEMAGAGQPLQPHLSARLERVEG